MLVLDAEVHIHIFFKSCVSQMIKQEKWEQTKHMVKERDWEKKIQKV